MNIVEINAYGRGSTGQIMFHIADLARRHGHTVTTYSSSVFSFDGPEKRPELFGHRYFGTEPEAFLHLALGQLFDGNGCFSTCSTLLLCRQLDRIKPDLIHLHNLHEYNISLPVLFAYTRRRRIPIVWSFHDCWAFTGHCMHFYRIKCGKWKDGCHDCPLTATYPKSRMDRSRAMWEKKRKWLTGQDLTIVAPSNWMASVVKESFLRQYPVRMIHNGIDLQVFRRSGAERVRERLSLQGRSMILGVAAEWDEHKGLDRFIQLASMLDDRCQIVLVGTDDRTDRSLPGNIISIHHTQDQQELAAYYSAADVFVNATREDTFPTVNLEALACGTPVLTFDVGGSPESIDEGCGCVVGCDDTEAMAKEIRRIVEEKPYTPEQCRRRAEAFEMNQRFEDYVRLFETLHTQRAGGA